MTECTLPYTHAPAFLKAVTSTMPFLGPLQLALISPVSVTL